MLCACATIFVKGVKGNECKAKSANPERISCLICHGRYLTTQQVKRHEVEVHLTKEEQIKFRSRKRALIPVFCGNTREEKSTDLTNTAECAITAEEYASQRKTRKFIKVSASDYECKAKSANPNRMSCLLCHGRYPTTKQVKAHEFHVHLTKEEQIKFSSRQRTLNRTSKNRLISNVTCGLITRADKSSRSIKLDAGEYQEKIASADPDRLSCILCGREYFTARQVRRHEIDVHLPREEQMKFRASVDWSKGLKRTKQMIPTHNVEDKEKVIEMKKVSLICEICGLATKSNKNLQVHMTTHTGEKNYLCSECGDCFAREHTLQSHELAIHKKERNHICQYCGKSFVFKYVKDNHEKKHFGGPKIPCHICGFTFSSNYNVKKHIQAVHENQRPYKCHLCDKSFKTIPARQYHVNTHKNPNGRKRGLNRDVDPMKAAAKRRLCGEIRVTANRVPLLTTVIDEIIDKSNNNDMENVNV